MKKTPATPIDEKVRFFNDFCSILGPFWEPKSIKNLTFSSIVAGSVFSGLESLLKLIFASTAGPANLDFEATLWHFLKFFRFSEDRVENDFKVISDLPKAQKNIPKSPKSGPKSSKKSASKKKIIF